MDTKQYTAHKTRILPAEPWILQKMNLWIAQSIAASHRSAFLSGFWRQQVNGSRFCTIKRRGTYVHCMRCCVGQRVREPRYPRCDRWPLFSCRPAQQRGMFMTICVCVCVCVCVCAHSITRAVLPLCASQSERRSALEIIEVESAKRRECKKRERERKKKQ